MLHARDESETSGLLASVGVVLCKFSPVVAFPKCQGFLYLLVNQLLYTIGCRTSRFL